METAIDKLSVQWKFDLPDKIKREFFHVEIIIPVHIPW